MRGSTGSTRCAVSAQRDREPPDRRALGRQDQPQGVRAPGNRAGPVSARSLLHCAACGGDDDDSAATGATDTTEGAPQPGGTLRTALISPAGGTRPAHGRRRGRPGDARPVGRVPRLVGRRARAPAAARRELGAERGRQRLDVHDPPGRHLPRRDADDGGGRRRDVGVPTPGNESNALSALTGGLSAGKRQPADETTVEFTLDAPNGNFPYLLSSDNYNRSSSRRPSTATGSRPSSARGPGSWRRSRPRSASRTSRTQTTGTRPGCRTPTRARSSSTQDEQARVTRAPGRRGRIVSNFSVAAGGALLDDPASPSSSSGPRSTARSHMRTDKEPFTDKRVRQAMALAIDRQALVDGLFEGKSRPRQRQPLRPRLPLHRSVRAAARAGHRAGEAAARGRGQGRRLRGRAGELAGLRDPRPRRSSSRTPAEEVGVTVELQITDAGAYYGDFTLRQVALARLALRHHRLRPPRRAERLPLVGARQRGAVERPALQEPRVRRAAGRLRGRVRPRRATGGRQTDPGAAPRRDACDLPVLLLPPGRDEETSTGSSRPEWATST